MNRPLMPRRRLGTVAPCLSALLAWAAVMLAAWALLPPPSDVLLEIGLLGAAMLAFAFWPGGRRRR